MIERARRRIFRTEALLVLAASLTVPALAQIAATPIPAAPTFEVTTVKVNNSGSTSSHSGMDHGSFTATNVLLKNVFQYEAYGIPEPRIFGGPKWLDSVRFDIEAKVDPAIDAQLQALPRDQRKLQTQAMFQKMLADRFKLATHWETRELPVYDLVVTKKPLGLQPASDTSGGTHTSSSNSQLKAQNITTPDLAKTLTQVLAQELGRVVIDKTGLTGHYDLTLTWNPDTDTPANGATDDTKPSIFTAIQEQLGLKLESARGPVQVLVIDHIEMPTEN